jgi:hypothetical protein
MASSMKLAYPLNDVLPNVEHTRDRLLAKVFEFRQSGLGKVLAKDEDYELLYAYGESHPVRLLVGDAILTSRQHW